MEEGSEGKNFKIEGDSKKKVVKFGFRKRVEPKEEETHVSAPVEDKSDEENSVEDQSEKKTVVNDKFAKYSAREELEEGEYSRELKHQLSLNSEFEAAFEKLDQGVKDGYLFYFSGPKLTASITNRIVKKIDRIIAGHGLNDCTCGKSKNLPNCDGSHKAA